MEEIIAFGFTAFLLFIYTIFAFLTIGKKMRVPTLPPPETARPRVSILKPLKGMDDQIRENLESFYQINYPDFEIIFGLDSMADPVITVIRNLNEKYPGVRVRILATGHSRRHNPKVHKLRFMERHAGGTLLWVTDSNVRVHPDALLHLLHDYLEKDTKLIFSPIHATGDRSIGSIIENCYINFFLSGCVIAAWKFFRQQLIVGKSMLLERATLERIGGFSHFLDYLAEDFVMGMTYRACRFSINTNYVWVSNINTRTSVSGFFQRITRWCKLRFRLKPTVYPFEILLNPFFPVIMTVIFLGMLPGLLIFGIIFLLKTLLELLNYRYVNRIRRRRLLHIFLISFLFAYKDLLLLAAYFLPFFSDTVNWRGGRVTIGRDTRISPSRESLLLKGA